MRLSDIQTDASMIEQRLLTRLTEKKARLDAARPLPGAAARRLGQQLAIEWTYNSNAIEGSTLSLRETKLILETGLTIGGKSLREHFEVINHQAAIDYVESSATTSEPITAYHVRQIHSLVLKSIDDEQAGQYRQIVVRIAGSTHLPPEAWEIPRLMNEWSDWLNGPARQRDPIQQAALAHHRLAAIHPFVDGNGRTARLVMNLLLRNGLPPAVILRANRRLYYRVLAQADRGATAPIINFVARAVERSLNLYLEAATSQVSPPATEARWIPLREAAEGTPYSQEYLSLLARTGRLDAMKRGRIWYTTRRAVETYRRSIR
jgi:Fic family protein